MGEGGVCKPNICFSAQVSRTTPPVNDLRYESEDMARATRTGRQGEALVPLMAVGLAREEAVGPRGERPAAAAEIDHQDTEGVSGRAWQRVPEVWVSVRPREMTADPGSSTDKRVDRMTGRRRSESFVRLSVLALLLYENTTVVVLDKGTTRRKRRRLRDGGEFPTHTYMYIYKRLLRNV